MSGKTRPNESPIESISEEAADMPVMAYVDVESWGLVPTYPLEREYAFVIGPWDGETAEDYPNNVMPLGDVLKKCVDQVGFISSGYWDGPRHFRVWVEEVEGLEVSPLVNRGDDSPTSATKLSNPRFRQHLKIQEQKALEDFREGNITNKQMRGAMRAGTDARVVDLLSLVRDQVDTMQLRYMGRYTSYYIDKYEVLRLIDQLVEDIVNGRTNIERVLRYELGSHPPEDWRAKRWLQGSEYQDTAEKGGNRPTHRR